MSLWELCEEKKISLLYTKYIQKGSYTGQADVITADTIIPVQPSQWVFQPFPADSGTG